MDNRTAVGGSHCTKADRGWSDQSCWDQESHTSASWSCWDPELRAFTSRSFQDCRNRESSAGGPMHVITSHTSVAGGSTHVTASHTSVDSLHPPKNNLTSVSSSLKISKKRGTGMSFVGVRYLNGTFSAFSDSKASIEVDGEIMEDTKRGKVRKIFKNGKYIVACSGRNEFRINPDDPYKYKIEDWMERNIGKYQDPCELSRALSLASSDNRKLEDIVLSYGLYREIDGKELPFLGRVLINTGEMTYKEWLASDPDATFSGNSVYVSYFDIFSHLLYLPEHDMQIRKLEQVKGYLDKYTFANSYDSVGGPFVITDL